MAVVNEIVDAQGKLFAETMLLRRYRESQVIRALMAPPKMVEGNNVGGLGLLKNQAVRLVKAVIEEWAQASEEERKQRRKVQRMSLENLYQLALQDKKYAVCVQIEKLLAQIDGTLAPVRVLVDEGKVQEDEFQDRSKAELDCFAKYGRWPEEMSPGELEVH